MATRYTRRLSDGTYEHHDSKESLQAAKDNEMFSAFSGLMILLGLIVGGYLTAHFSSDEWPKWIRFSLVIFGSVSLAYLLYKISDWVLYAILTLLAGIIIFFIVRSIWGIV